MASALMNCLREVVNTSSTKVPQSLNDIQKQQNEAIIKWKNMNSTSAQKAKIQSKVEQEDDFCFHVRSSKRKRHSNIYIMQNAKEPKKEVSLPIVNMGVLSHRGGGSRKTTATANAELKARSVMASYLKRQATVLPKSTDNCKYFAQYVTDESLQLINSNLKERKIKLKEVIHASKETPGIAVATTELTSSRANC